MTYIATALTVACLVTAGSSFRTANADETQQGASDPGTVVRSSARDGLDLDTQAEPLELNFGALQDDSSEANGWRVDFNTCAWLSGIECDVGDRGSRPCSPPTTRATI